MPLHHPPAIPSSDWLLKKTPWTAFSVKYLSYADVELLVKCEDQTIQSKAERVDNRLSTVRSVAVLGLSALGLGLMMMGIDNPHAETLSRIGVASMLLVVGLWWRLSMARTSLKNEIGTDEHLRMLLAKSLSYSVRNSRRKSRVYYANRSIVTPMKTRYATDSWYRQLDATCREATAQLRQHPEQSFSDKPHRQQAPMSGQTPRQIPADRRPMPHLTGTKSRAPQTTTVEPVYQQSYPNPEPTTASTYGDWMPQVAGGFDADD